MDWAASCGNMLSAVALATVASPLIPYTTLFSRAKSLPQPPFGSPLLFPLSILSASNGNVMRARVPIDPLTLQVWEPPEGEGCTIAGVPGEDAGIEVEMPIELGEDGGGWLVTGRAKDVVVVDGRQVSPPVELPPALQQYLSQALLHTDPHINPHLGPAQHLCFDRLARPPHRTARLTVVRPHLPPEPSNSSRKDPLDRGLTIRHPALARLTQDHAARPAPRRWLHLECGRPRPPQRGRPACPGRQLG